MKFAINYSLQAAKLLRDGRIEVDYFKLPDWPEEVAEARQLRPTYVHYPLRAGRGRVQVADLDHIERMLGESDTRHVNMHLGPKASDFKNMPLDTRDPADAKRLIDAVRRDVDLVTGRFGAERVILENITWNPRRRWRIPIRVSMKETTASAASAPPAPP